MKKIILALMLLLIAGCTTETAVLEEIQESPITAMTVAEIPVLEEDTSPYYTFTEGETKIIDDHKITLTEITLEPKVFVEVDGIEGSLVETKNEEIINEVKIYIDKIDRTDINNPIITLKIEELNLEDNQYILIKNTRVRIENKDVILLNSKSSGHISIMVYDKNDIKGEDGTLAKGETLELNSLSITNLKNYYKVSQYAIVEVQKL